MFIFNLDEGRNERIESTLIKLTDKLERGELNILQKREKIKKL